MRTFMVGFLIFILASCLSLLMFKPLFSKEKKEITTETSRVEELLTGEQNIPETEESIPIEISSEFKPYEDEFKFEPKEYLTQERPNPEDYAQAKQELAKIKKELKLPENINVEDINKMNLPQQNMIDEKSYKEMENQINKNSNMKSIADELKEKYNNDPNAVVSEEDLNYFMLKMLESSQK